MACAPANMVVLSASRWVRPQWLCASNVGVIKSTTRAKTIIAATRGVKIHKLLANTASILIERKKVIVASCNQRVCDRQDTHRNLVQCGAFSPCPRPHAKQNRCQKFGGPKLRVFTRMGAISCAQVLCT